MYNSIMKKMRWNPKNLYDDVKSFDKDVVRLNKEVKKYGEVPKDVSTINKIHFLLKQEKRIDTILYKILTYIMIRKEVSNSEQLKYKEKEVNSLFSTYLIFTQKFEYAILGLSKDRQQRILKSPQIKLYKRRLELIIDRKRKSSKKEEEFLTHLDPITENIPSLYGQILKHISYNDIETSQNVYKKINNSNIKKLSRSEDRDIRRKVYQEKIKAFDKTSSAFTEILDISLKDKNVKSILSKDNSPIEYVLREDSLKDRHISIVLNSILKNQDIISKFLKLKKNILNTKKIYSYDEKHDAYPYKMSLNKALTMVEDSLSLFNNDSKQIFNNLAKKNHLHITSKTDTFIPYSGYCMNYGITSPYLFVYYQNDLDSGMTIAHELGHVIHQEKMIRNNSFWDRDTSLIIHETASYTHEIIFLLNLLNKTKNKKTKKKILFKLIQYYYDIFVLKGVTTKFERHLYKQVQNNKPLRTDILSQKYKEIQEEFKGKEFSLNKFSEKEWIGDERLTWSFYELKYIIAFALANKIAFGIFHEDHNMINKFNKMMKLGDENTTRSILQLFETSFSGLDQLIQDAFKTLDSLIEEFEEL